MSRARSEATNGTTTRTRGSSRGALGDGGGHASGGAACASRGWPKSSMRRSCQRSNCPSDARPCRGCSSAASRTSSICSRENRSCPADVVAAPGGGGSRDPSSNAPMNACMLCAAATDCFSSARAPAESPARSISVAQSLTEVASHASSDAKVASSSPQRPCRCSKATASICCAAVVEARCTAALRAVLRLTSPKASRSAASSPSASTPTSDSGRRPPRVPTNSVPPSSW